MASFEESECEFLSIPTSVDFWPSEDIKDYHKSCIKMKTKEVRTIFRRCASHTKNILN